MASQHPHETIFSVLLEPLLSEHAIVHGPNWPAFPSISLLTKDVMLVGLANIKDNERYIDEIKIIAPFIVWQNALYERGLEKFALNFMEHTIDNKHQELFKSIKRLAVKYDEPSAPKKTKEEAIQYVSVLMMNMMEKYGDMVLAISEDLKRRGLFERVMVLKDGTLEGLGPRFAYLVWHTTERHNDDTTASERYTALFAELTKQYYATAFYLHNICLASVGLKLSDGSLITLPHTSKTEIIQILSKLKKDSYQTIVKALAQMLVNQTEACEKALDAFIPKFVRFYFANEDEAWANSIAAFVEHWTGCPSPDPETGGDLRKQPFELVGCILKYAVGTDADLALAVMEDLEGEDTLNRFGNEHGREKFVDEVLGTNFAALVKKGKKRRDKGVVGSD